MQERMENEWIEKYNQVQLELYEKERVERRKKVVRISYDTRKREQAQVEKLAKKLDRRVRLEQKQDAESKSKDLLIEALNLDSKYWITKDNITDTVKGEIFVPHSPGMKEYYNKLRQSQEKSVALDYEQQHHDNMTITQLRNKVLHSQYIEVRGIIKRLTYTPLVQLEEDFNWVKSRLFNKPDQLQLLQQNYQELANNLKALFNDQSHYLQTLKNQLVLLDSLITHWNRYSITLNLPDARIQIIATALVNKDQILDEYKGQLNPDQQEDDLVNPQAETSDYFDLEFDKEQFYERLHRLESREEVQFRNIFEEQEVDLGEGLDLYGEHEVKQEEAQLEQRTSLDSFLETLELQIRQDKDLFGGAPIENVEQVVGEQVYSPTMTYFGIRKYLQSLSVQELAYQENQLRDESLKLLDKLESIRIEEPKLLKEVFDYFRYKSSGFKID